MRLKNRNCDIMNSRKMQQKSKKLEQRFYQYEQELNPDYIRYQRTESGTLGQSMTFNVRNILPNSLLSAKAYIKWSFSVDKVKNTAPQVAVNFSNADQIFAKANILENCITNINVAYNGYNIGQYNEPRYWAKYLTRSFKSDQLLFSTDGARDPDYNGGYDDNGLPTDTNPLLPGIDDKGVREGIDLIKGSIVAGQPTATFSFLSLLNFGLFNKYYLDNKYAKVGWQHRMSNVIPYVKNLDVNIDLSDISTNALNYMFGITSAAGFESPELVNAQVTSAQLVLQWLDIPGSPNNLSVSRDYFGESADYKSIPDEVVMQSYTTRFRKFPIGVVNNDDVFTLSPTPSPEMDLHSIPDYFLIFATVDKDSAGYNCIANTFASDQAGTNQGFSDDVNAYESNMNFDELRIRTNINTEIVDTRWNSQELYNLTLSNSKKNYPFTQFVGGIKYLSAYPSNAYVLVKPSDIGISKSAGQCANRLTLQLEGLLRATDGNVGFNQSGPGDKSYVLCIVQIYSSYGVTMDSTGKINADLQGKYY